MPQARFPRDKVRTEGRSTQYVRTGDRGTRATFHFCPASAPVYYLDRGFPEVIAVPVGAFADPSFPPPRVSVYEERRHSWTGLPPDGLRLTDAGSLEGTDLPVGGDPDDIDDAALRVLAAAPLERRDGPTPLQPLRALLGRQGEIDVFTLHLAVPRGRRDDEPSRLIEGVGHGHPGKRRNDSASTRPHGSG